MDQNSQDRVAEVEQLKGVIGWSWNEVANRAGWGPHGLIKVRALKAPIEERWLQYFRDVAFAVQAVPMPTEVEDAPMHETHELDPATERAFRAAGLQPAAEQPTQEVRVMMLDDIAAKLAAEYMALRRNTEMSPDNREGAQWMIGRLAEQMGVTAEVRRLVSAPAPDVQVAVQRPLTPQVIAVPSNAPWAPPQPDAALSREPF